MKKGIHYLSLVSLIFFEVLVVSYAYEGIITIPTEGDSVVYHIPIAQSILNGHVLNPTFILGYYPGIAEGILAIFMLLRVPLNLFNVVGVVMLFFVLTQVGKASKLQSHSAVIFAVTFCTMHGIVRWLNTQIIDIWVAVFFSWLLLLFLKPQKSLWYFMKIGIATGLLIGAKYSGPLFAVVLFLVFGKRLLPALNLKKIILFLLPVILLGISWYGRNIFLVQNPFYPQSVLFLEGAENWNIFNIHIWEAMLFRPMLFLNAIVAEYMVWAVLFLVGPVLLVFSLFRTRIFSTALSLRSNNNGMSLLLIGVLNLIIFLFLPTSFEYNIIVSSFRYSYPVVIPLLLCAFIFAQKYNKEELVALVAIAGMFMLPSLEYRPKLLLVVFLLFFILKKLFIPPGSPRSRG